ncbi:shikimate kinase [Winogradskyella sp. PE311]|uniref:shikimate kinase n=1 Tax=Winogradskyella sp. PE311 TaxID=3366943 RepID=UPI00397FFD2D
MIVVLMGYMGSGKSTIGKELAKILNYEFIDLDQYIEDEELNLVSDIFSAKGEIYFRKQETKYLKKIINSSDDMVLALGGGTPCYGNNLMLLANNNKVLSFYLNLSIPKLVKRLFEERENRPLISYLNSEDEMQEFIGKHLFERSQFYRQADFIINSDDKSIKDVTEKILLKLI